MKRNVQRGKGGREIELCGKVTVKGRSTEDPRALYFWAKTEAHIATGKV